jgi:hypothetical protein
MKKHQVLVVLLIVALALTLGAWQAKCQVASPTSILVGDSCEGWTDICSDFNSTKIALGSFIWFSAAVKVIGADPNEHTVVGFFCQTIDLDGMGKYTVPDGVIDLIPLCDFVKQYHTKNCFTIWIKDPDGVRRWHTYAPACECNNIFISGFTLYAFTSYPGCVKPICWAGQFQQTTLPDHTCPDVEVQWHWSAAVYKLFSSFPGDLQVKACDECVLGNSDCAGTPEAFKQYVIPGARGDGGCNFTGWPTCPACVFPSCDD